MSGSKDWNDLDAGGDGKKPSKHRARPDLQEKMRRRFHNLNPGSSSENTSPVPFEEGAAGRMGASRHVPEGAAAASAASTPSRGKQKDRGETPELNGPDANGNFMFDDIHSSPPDSGRLRTSTSKASKGQGRKLQGQAAGNSGDHLDKALNSVIDELDRNEISHKDQKGSKAVFENNFEDLESPQALNIPAGGGVFARQGAFGGNIRPQGLEKHKKGSGQKDRDDEMVGKKQEQQQPQDPFQEMVRSLMGGDQNVNERGDPLAALFRGQPGGNRNNEGLGGLFDIGRGREGNPLAALLGNGGGERNDNDNPLAAMLGVGRDPLAGMLGGRGAAEAGKNMQNFGNDFRSSLAGGKNRKRQQRAKRDDGDSTNSEEDSSSEDEDSNVEENPLDFGQQKRDPIRAMLDEMTNDMKENGNPLAALGAPGVGGKNRQDGLGQMGGVKGLDEGGLKGFYAGGRQGGGGNPPASVKGHEENPLKALMGGEGRGKSGIEPAGNPLEALLGGGGRGRGGGEPGGNPFEALMGGGGRERGGLEPGGNPLAALMGGGGRGGLEPGGNPFEALMGGGGRGRGGGEPVGNPLEALMGGGGRGRGGGEPGGNPLAALLGGGGRGRGGGEAARNPLEALIGGGGRGRGGLIPDANPLSALMGGGGGGGGEAGGNFLGNPMVGRGNPLAGLSGDGGGGGIETGGNPLAALMVGAGRGGSGLDRNPVAGLMGGQDGVGRSDVGGLSGMFGGGGMSGGGGDQMSQALATVMGRGGGGAGGADPMMSLLSSQGGGGGDNMDGPQQKLLRQMMGQAGLNGEDELTPENAGDNEILQQLLAYESMRAKSSRSPRVENAMSTIIVVDTSGSMDGEPLIEAGQFISQFINGLEELQFEYNFQENVALVCVGGETQVVQHFTNDYRLIRQATDSLSASGSSRLHLGLVLPSALLSHGNHDKSPGGVCYINNNYVACPRVIFISDGYPTATDDIPGQQPRPNDELTLALQNICLEVLNTVVEKTLCKVYCVPVGNCNLNFMEMLSSSTGGRVIQQTDAKHMSHCILHHNLVAKLRETSQREPTRQAVADLLKQVTATADEDDINGVFEVIREGEPDIQARDARVTQEMMQVMQARGRGGGRGNMQGMEEMAALVGQGQGQMPGGLQSMMGGGQGQGLPPFMSRGRPGGGVPMIRPGGGGLGGMQALLRMGGNRGQGGQGQGMENLIRLGGGGGMEGLMGMGGNRGQGGQGQGMENLIRLGGGSGGMEGLMGMDGNRGQGGQGQGMENLIRLGGGGGMQGLMGMGGNRGQGGQGQGMESLIGMSGGGGGPENLIRMGRGREAGGQGQGMESLMGMGRGRGEGVGGLGVGTGPRGIGNQENGLEALMMGRGRCGQGESGGLGSAGNGQLSDEGLGLIGNRNENIDGLGLISDEKAGPQAMLGMGKPGQIGAKKELSERDALYQRMLGLGNGDKENERGKSMFNDLPGGSLQAMLGLRDPAENMPNDKGDADQGKDRKKSKKHRSQKRKDAAAQSEVGLGCEDDSSGQFQDKEEEGQAAQGGGLGLLSGDEPQAMFGMERGSKSNLDPLEERSESPQMQRSREGAVGNDYNSKAKKKGRKARKNKSGDVQKKNEEKAEASDNPEMGGVGNADAPRQNVPRRRNDRGRGLFNNCPPVSFGLDEHGNPRNVDLMGGLGGNDIDGEDLMEKLSSLLENSDFGNDGGILGDDANDNDGNQEDGGGLLRGLPDILGLGAGRVGRMPGMPGNQGNPPQNVGGGMPNIRSFFQNMGRESMGQNFGGGRDEDGDVIMEGLGGGGQPQGGAPFPGLGNIGGGNLPFGPNRGQQDAAMQQGFGQGMNGAPGNLEQFAQMLQNAQGGNQGIPSVEQMLARFGMGGHDNMPDRQNPYGDGEG